MRHAPGEIMKIGAYWGYKPEICDGCEHLEISLPFPDGERLVACDAPESKCVKDGRQVYPNKKSGGSKR